MIHWLQKEFWTVLFFLVIKNRVVVTGIGVVSPNAIGTDQFLESLKQAKSGITFQPEMERLKFSCQVAGVPSLSQELLEANFNELELKSTKSLGLIYGIIAAKEAWSVAGLEIDNTKTDWDTGCLFGTGMLGMNVIRDAIYTVDDFRVKKLGSRMIDQTMSSGISAHLGGIFGFGNHVSTNSSACNTGSESIALAFERIQNGQAKRMLVGGCDGTGPYVWGGFDSMRVLNRKMNDSPEKASRPMSESASGFVPGGGAGALVLEEYETAKARKAPMFMEVIGAHYNSGGQRNGGTMTAPNDEGVVRCIQRALLNAQIESEEIDLINGHLTATMGDVREMTNWSNALKLNANEFPIVQSTKGMIGHCLSSSGAIESVAVAIQIKNSFVHQNMNCEDLHPAIEKIVTPEKIQFGKLDSKLNVVVKASFGFGDVNSVLIFKKLDV